MNPPNQLSLARLGHNARRPVAAILLDGGPSRRGGRSATRRLDGRPPQAHRRLRRAHRGQSAALALALAASFAVGACTSGGDECTSNADCPPSFVCALGQCSPMAGADGFDPSFPDGSIGGDTTEPDATSPGADTRGPDPDPAGDVTTPPGDTGGPLPIPDTVGPDPDAEPDAGADDASAPDAAPPDGIELDVEEDAIWDIVQPDTTPPEVLSSDPADGELDVQIPFVVTVVFNEPIRQETVDVSTIYVQDVLGGGAVITGQPQLSADGTTVTLAPFPNTTSSARPYRLVVTTIVQDVAGNKLQKPYHATFYTGTPDPGDLALLAIAYSPFARQAVGSQPQYDYPTRFDFDGDLVSANNPASLEAATELYPAAYWDVVESKSHIFLTYVYLYPLRQVEAGATPVINDVAGVTLVLSKFPAVQPLAAYTYGRKGASEELFAYAVQGTLLAGKPLVTQTADFETLFEQGFFKLYLTTPRHQACSWGVGGPGDCALNPGILLELKLATLAYGDGLPSAITKAGGTWPGDGTEATLELIPLVSTLWPRRDSTGSEGIWGSSFDYQPPPGRPGGDLDPLPVAFYAPVTQSGGRPPWAWSWSPTSGGFTNLPQGTFFLDPAFFLAKRHQLDGDAFDPETGAGWSQQYCYHPYLDIDLRGVDPDCPAFSFE